MTAANPEVIKENPNIFSEIGRVIERLWGVEPKPVDENLEDRVNKKLADERAKIRPSKEDINMFSWVTGDNNPIHRIQKRAKKLGFEDTPLMGAHVAAYGEQFIEDVVENMRQYWGADIKIVGQSNKFRSPLYPGERVLWQVRRFNQRDSSVELEVTGTVKDRQIITITSKLGAKYPQMPQIGGPIFSERYLIEADHLDEFFNCVGGTNKGRVPHMLPAAFVPATLLNLLKEKTQTLEGANMAMDFDFLNEASPGKLQVDIYPPRKPLERQGQFIYKFRAVVSQDTRPITYGEILSSAPIKIEF